MKLNFMKKRNKANSNLKYGLMDFIMKKSRHTMDDYLNNSKRDEWEQNVFKELGLTREGIMNIIIEDDKEEKEGEKQ